MAAWGYLRLQVSVFMESDRTHRRTCVLRGYLTYLLAVSISPEAGHYLPAVQVMPAVLAVPWKQRAAHTTPRWAGRMAAAQETRG